MAVGFKGMFLINATQILVLCALMFRVCFYNLQSIQSKSLQTVLDVKWVKRIIKVIMFDEDFPYPSKSRKVLSTFIHF